MMVSKSVVHGLASLAFVTLVVPTVIPGRSALSTQTLTPPRTFDDEAVRSGAVPLATADASPVQISADTYYRIPVAPVYRNYPVYHPDKEPAGYFASLEKVEPETAFDAAALKTTADWIKAGELVFDAPNVFVPPAELRDPLWHQRVAMPLTSEGVVPFYRYVVREKGKVELGWFSCGTCHTRILPDGAIVKGAQGNFPLHRVQADQYVRTPNLDTVRRAERELYSAPWLGTDAYPNLGGRSLKEIVALHQAIPPGVIARHGTSPLVPVKVPDLIGVRERHYLDATGLARHRDISDLMRYAAMNQTTDLHAAYRGFVPRDTGGDPVQFFKGRGTGRYSDEQLYALSLYLYSLTPPPNPNRPGVLSARGEEVFERENCGACHTPPLYTNNRLTMARGFTPPVSAFQQYDVMRRSVATDPDLALKTRRGTGYYKVPSLKGVWYRGPFQHSGSVATLEDWFDPRRLRDDYVPTGFKGYGIETRAVQGHPFGLKLSATDKQALIAFLRTL
jgi:hypothetical protein